MSAYSIEYVNSPAGEGSPVVPEYNYATGEYMRPNYYGDRNLHGLEEEINNRNTRMGRSGYAPVPNYMIGNGNSPMHRGGNNLFPSPQQGFRYLTTGGYPPPTAMPQNANVYPAMFNHRTGNRIDPQSGGLVPYAPKGMVDKHSSSAMISHATHNGMPEYLQDQPHSLHHLQHNYGGYGNLPYRDIKGSGGYEYRQFSDGSIKIMKAPNNQGKGLTLKSGSNWTSITNEIGAYPTLNLQTGKPQLDNVIQQGQALAQTEQGKNFLSTIFGTFLTGQELKQQELELQKLQAQQQQQQISTSMEPSAWDKSQPYIIALVAVAAVGTLAFVATSPKPKSRSKRRR